MVRWFALLMLIAVPGVARAEADPEYQYCTQYGIDVHNFIDCLVTARDGWDKKLGNRVSGLNGAQRAELAPLRKKQRAARVEKCGTPVPKTIAAAECQRAMAKEQAAEYDAAAAALK